MKILSYIPILITGLTFAQSQNQNYIKTTTYTKPNQEQSIESIQYFDGLGRPIQAITKGQATGGQDIVQHIEYDAWGRQSKEFLPLINGSGSLNFRDNAGNATLSFYNDILGDPNAFAEKNIENSPLNRVLAQGAPGTDWALTNGHTIRFQYQANSYNDKVVQIKVNLDANFVPTFTVGDYYPDNTLYKNVTTDENGNNSEEYKNVEGQVILKRTFATMANVKTPLNTYYVYDDYANLTLVIPPVYDVIANTPLNNTLIETLCYKYQYNNKNLLINKKLPGKGAQNLYYDDKDRLVASYVFYSPNQGTSRSYIYNFYDDFNRIIATGHKNGSTYRPTTINNVNVLTQNFYDNYQFATDFSIPSTILGESVNTNVKGYATGSKIANIDENFISNNPAASTIQYDVNIILYDIKYRPIANYTYYPNGGYYKVENLIDFMGKTIETHTYHKANSDTSEIYIKEVFSYNQQNQLITHTHQINNGSIENLATNTYNILSQLQQKAVGGQGTALQNIDYDYNIRGWLTNINNINQPNDKLFNFNIKYNETDVTDLNSNAKPLFNGNIAATQWVNALDNTLRHYTYNYDEINRLLTANYKNQINNLESFDENLTYDKNGNILTLNRKGIIDPLSGSSETIDQLQYTYNSSYRNRLTKVVDQANNAEGFNQNGLTSTMFTHDNEGNLTADLTKGIQTITYNHLSLPTTLIFSNGAKIEYIYNANGTKIAKKVYHDTNQPPVVTTYRNGFQYIDGVLKFFPHAEGYVNVAENQNFEYIYNYTDHLGNVRVSYKYDQTATETNNIAIVDANNYYPFGLKHKGYGSPNQTPNYKYKYNGKELQDELGVNWYDYGARNYDAALGRWMNVDPLAEKYPGWTPYHYVHNNPINMVDPTGMEADGWIKSLKDDKATYTYDATITSQADVDEFLPGKEYMGENFQLTGSNSKTNEVAYQYNFQGKNVTDGSGQNVDLTNNFTTKGGSTIMNPENTGGKFSGLTLGGAVGGGISLQLGVVSDNFGDSSLYFTFGGNAGLGGGVGITSGIITPTNNQTFAINDFNGMGNSWNVNVGFLSYERGGTQGNGYKNFGQPTLQTPRSYIYNSGSQAGHYPAAQLNNISPKAQFKGISGGGMISSTRTWVF